MWDSGVVAPWGRNEGKKGTLQVGKNRDDSSIKTHVADCSEKLET